MFHFLYAILVAICCMPALQAKSDRKVQNPPTQTAAPHEDRVFLDSPLLAFADGKEIGINAEYIGFILQIIRELHKMQEGDEHGKGIFLMNHHSYTLQQLVELERKGLNQAELKECLVEVKKYFCAKILPFNEYSRGAIKPLILKLIEDCCTQRNRPNSFLLTWNSCPDGQEEETFMLHITNFETCSTFVAHLKDFLKDMVFSCPKARAAFLAKIKADAH